MHRAHLGNAHMPTSDTLSWPLIMRPSLRRPGLSVASDVVDGGGQLPLCCWTSKTLGLYEVCARTIANMLNFSKLSSHDEHVNCARFVSSLFFCDVPADGESALNALSVEEVELPVDNCTARMVLSATAQKCSCIYLPHSRA